VLQDPKDSTGHAADLDKRDLFATADLHVPFERFILPLVAGLAA